MLDLCVCVWSSLSSVSRSACWRICRGFQFCFAALLHTLILLHTSKKSHHIFTRGQITAISLSLVSLSLVPALTLDFFSGKSSDIHFSSDYCLLRSCISHTTLSLSLSHTHTHTHTHTLNRDPGSYWTFSRDLANQRGWIQDKLTGHKSNRAESHPTRSLST